MALPIAVADTSVLSYLHYLDLLHHLSLLFHRVYVPTSVRHEFLAWDENKNREAALTVLISGSFFVPCDTYDSAEVTLYLLEKLHQAEAEALSQTKHQNAEYLLIDEKQGRRIAEQKRRKVRGTARILADLYLLGVVDLWDNIRRLREETTFRITDKIIQQAILDAKAERELLL